MTKPPANSGQYMQLALKEARKNLRLMHGGPFGACIIKNREVLAVSRNTVLKGDATCHAEINAIRIASRKLRSFDLSGCLIYSTTEPCPMCFSAIHWARIGTIVYGTAIHDVKKLGFNEMMLSNETMKRCGRSGVRIVKGFLKDQCRELLADWSRLPQKISY